MEMLTAIAHARAELLVRVQLTLDGLPHLEKESVPVDESCPICLVPFGKILEDEEGSTCGHDQEDSGEAEGGKDKGITKLECGHIFCRKDLVEWIRSLHGSCPTCRNPFLDVQIPESDGESSDGDYVPESEGDDDDGFETDDYVETGSFEDEFDVAEGVLDMDDMWLDNEEDFAGSSDYGDLSEFAYDVDADAGGLDEDVHHPMEDGDHETLWDSTSTEDPK